MSGDSVQIGSIPVFSIVLRNPQFEPGTAMDWINQEFLALTPLVEASKVGTAHEGHDGWSMGGEPRLARCGCGEPMPWMNEGARGHVVVRADRDRPWAVGDRVDVYGPLDMGPSVSGP